MATSSSGSGVVAGLLRESAGTVVGGAAAWIAACVVAGAIPVLLTERQLANALPTVGFAWLVHLVVAGLGIWGIAFVCMHVWCLHALLFTEGDRLRPLAITFLGQLTVSTLATVMMASERAGLAWMGWGAIVVGGAGALWLRSRGEAVQRSAEPGCLTDRWEALAVAPTARSRTLSQTSRLTGKRTYDKEQVAAVLRSRVRRYYAVEK